MARSLWGIDMVAPAEAPDGGWVRVKHGPTLTRYRGPPSWELTTCQPLDVRHPRFDRDARRGARGPPADLVGLFPRPGCSILSSSPKAPVAIRVAGSVGADRRPLPVAPWMSFVIPLGHQINTMLLGPGRYRFADFTKIRTPLTLVVWIVCRLLIPVLWPL